MSDSNTKAQEARQFEREVAAVYRALGAQVAHDASLAGNQIDVFVTEQTPSGVPIRTIVECKHYARPVGIDIVNGVAALYGLLRQRSLVEKGVLVSASGFTAQARAAGQTHGLELLEFDDLKQRVRGRESALRQAEREVSAQHTEGEASRRLFVLMPFAREYEDIYILGIREVAEKLGLVVERADGIEHNQGILEIILERISSADVVVAETTDKNPNVMYEVGYSHALAKETILLTRNVENIPFDLRTKNHIIYDMIIDLREKLEARLKSTLNL